MKKNNFSPFLHLRKSLRLRGDSKILNPIDQFKVCLATGSV